MDHPALSHIEKTLADAYRKEIDQEENVWRSLPFFAATLALQLTAAPRRFQYLSRETQMFRYAEDLIRTEEARQDGRREDQFDSLSALKRELAHQYAVATTHNKQINKTRELLRAFAGLSVIASVLTTLILVSVAFFYYISSVDQTGDHLGRSSFVAPPGPGRSGTAPSGVGTEPPITPGRADAPANADNH